MLATQPSRLDESQDGSRFTRVWESLAVFVLGLAVMNFYYAQSASGPGAEIGAPGHDSFYHVKMAALMPQHGILRSFPWLQYSYFTDEGDEFVSHHYGFHVFLVPFVYLSRLVTGEFLPGGRWAVCVVFGLNMMLFNLLLRQAGLRKRWIWLVLFLLMPNQFFLRHSFVRAIGISLVMMQLIVLLLFRRRYVLASLALAAYVHIYLGAVMYGPVIVASLAVAQAFGPKEDRRLPWRMVSLTTAGWAIGALTYPYFDGMIEFLRLQVVGSGLSPDIEVGREWMPYTDPWWFVRMSAILLIVWTSALCIRARSGPRLNSKELGLLLLNFAFLTLTLKARRFIEYWPPFCLLSAAYLMAPVLAAGAREVGASESRSSRRRLVPVGATLGVLAICWYAATRPGAALILAEWPTWAFCAALFLLGPLSLLWLPRAAARVGFGRLVHMLIVPVCGAVFVLTILLLMVLRYGADGMPTARLHLGVAGWSALAAVYFLVPMALLAVGRFSRPIAARRAAVLTGGMMAAGLASLAVPVALGTRQIVALSREMSCYYDLGEIRRTMSFLKSHSDPGDIVFTDDWDVFPVYFYHNSYNNYVVGLDPKFTHERRPDLWERYVKISRGQTPATVRVSFSQEGQRRRETLSVSLADIRDHFHAKYVLTDRDHKRLARKLAGSGTFAELIYPSSSYKECEDAPYLLFRISDSTAPRVAANPPQPDSHGRLYLGLLQPAGVDQGWGDLMIDRSVDDRPLMVDGVDYQRGLGTHAPSTLRYDIPDGYRVFEALVAVDDETNGFGSAVVSVYVDGVRAYESPVLTGGAAPTMVRVTLGDARSITLRAEPTADGMSNDHVDWIDARLVRASGLAGSSEISPVLTALEAPATLEEKR